MITLLALRRFFIFATCTTLVTGSGCIQFGGRPGPGTGSSGTTTQDRLVQTYQDLASRKFQVVADFESAAQATLFHRDSAHGGTVELTTQQSRRETGVGSLKMSFTDSAQQVSAMDSSDVQWALLRDWTPYHLLIFSVFSPRSLGGFHFSARSGTNVPLTYSPPRFSLEQGWNLVRIDLGLLSDQINLADVRELRFWCDPLESPVDLYLDDLILVNNARQIFGSTEPVPGELFVRAEGGRLVVGAIERFELVFSDGVIRQWFDLGSDPVRARNLTSGQPLGPIPIGIPEQVDAAGFPEQVLKNASPGPTLEAHQELLEATPLRVVVRGEWRPHEAVENSDGSGPPRRWLYSVLADGRVYIECTGSSKDLVSAVGVGMAFCSDADAGFNMTMVSQGTDTAGPGGHEPYSLFSRTERGRADLLVAPFGQLTGISMQRPGDPRLCSLWQVSGGESRFTFAAMLRVWPPDLDGPSQALPMLTDYRHPLPMLVDTGSLARNDPGDFDGDGFSEGRGYYSLQLDGTIAKVRVNGVRYMRFSPVFRVTNVGNRDIWVYVDGRQIQTYRESQGDAFFEVKGPISQEVLVELTSRDKGAK